MEPSKPNRRNNDGGRGGGARGGRGGRGGRRNNFDRKDRQGRGGNGHQPKKHGGGKHNWGSNYDQVKSADAEDTANASPVEEEPEEPKEPERVVFTLEEYEAKRKAALAERDDELFGEVEVREIDDTEFEGLKTNVEELGDYMGNEANKKYKKKNKKEKVIVSDIGFVSKPIREERDNYRGRGRGGRGRKGRNPNVEDLSAFPTLG